MVRQVIEMYDRDGKFIDCINSEHLLENPEIEHFVQLDGYYEDESMQVQQLIIELTGKCNLRCKYCIYNDYYEGNRDFNTSDISFETAKRQLTMRMHIDIQIIFQLHFMVGSHWSILKL